MGECLILKAGAGTDTSNATANAEHILSGYTAYVNDMLVTGTMVNHGSVSNELSAGDSVELEKGYYELSTLTVKTLASQTKATAISSDILAPKTAWVNGAIITGNMVNRGAVTYGLPINGAYTIPSGFHNGAGKVTQSIATQDGWTVTPRSSNVLACDAGRYTTGAIWVAGDGNLVSGNIRKGVSIFGVGGSFEGPASNPYWLYRNGLQNGQTVTGTGSSKNEGSEIYVDGPYGSSITFVNLVDMTNYKYLKVRGHSTMDGGRYTYKCPVVLKKLNDTTEYAKAEALSDHMVWAVGIADISNLRGLYMVELQKAYYIRSNVVTENGARYNEVYLHNV